MGIATKSEVMLHLLEKLCHVFFVVLNFRQFGLVVMLANTLKGKGELFILTCE